MISIKKTFLNSDSTIMKNFKNKKSFTRFAKGDNIPLGPCRYLPY